MLVSYRCPGIALTVGLYARAAVDCRGPPRLAPWGEARILRSLPRVGGRRCSVSHSLRSGLYRHRASGAPLGSFTLLVGLYARAAVDSRGGCSGEQPYMGWDRQRVPPLSHAASPGGRAAASRVSLGRLSSSPVRRAARGRRGRRPL